MSWGRMSNFTLRADKTVCSSAVGRRKRTLLFCIPPQGKKLGAGCSANSANPSIARWLGSRTDAPYGGTGARTFLSARVRWGTAKVDTKTHRRAIQADKNVRAPIKCEMQAIVRICDRLEVVALDEIGR